MPYGDYEKKIGHMKLWRKKKMSQGYGKWIYARRKLRFDNEERFRFALERIIHMPTSELNPDGLEQAAMFMQVLAQDALDDSRRAEEALGPFVPNSQI